jgi:hypothetical protein
LAAVAATRGRGARHPLTLLRRVDEVRRIVHLTAAMQPA